MRQIRNGIAYLSFITFLVSCRRGEVDLLLGISQLFPSCSTLLRELRNLKYRKYSRTNLRHPSKIKILEAEA
jgi:hypothetical protein